MYEGLYDTRDGLSEEDAEVIGLMTGHLLLPWDRWVHRRVERAVFCDDNALRRETSVDFTLPQWFHNARKTPKGQAIRQLVPLGFLRKGVLVNFSLQDETNLSLPLLTSPQNSQVAAAILRSLAQGVLGDIPEGIRCDLRSLVRESPDNAAATHFHLFNEHDAAWEQREALKQSETFVNISELFRDHFLALTMLKIGRHERRVLHFSYEESVWDSDPRDLTNFLKRTVALAFGRPRMISIGVPAAAETASYHIEVEAPDGLMITARESYAYLEDDTEVERYHAEGGYQRAHFYFSHIPHRSRANVAVHLQPRRSTIVRGASLTALLAFATILAVTIRLPTGGGSEAATALLLAANGIIGLFIVRGGEDQMATTLLFPLRLLAVMPVVLSVGAATVVVMHLGEFASRILLIGISLLTAIATGFLLRNWYLVRKVQDV